jgi:probable F420-dependent oxidoreductase
MRLGCNIPNFGPTATPADLLGWARFAEAEGFDLAMVSDHVAPTPDVSALYPPPFYDPFATLAWLAGHDLDLTIGTTVAIIPYRHPLHTARLAANIDQFTGGRFVLGVGIGWSEQEYQALGAPFGERGRMTDEYLGAILDAWTSDEASHDGHYVSYADVSTGPRPLATPHPPLWVGGHSSAAITRAARFGDAWHPIYPDRRWLRERLVLLERAAEECGRPVPRLCPRIKARLTDFPVPDPDRALGVGTLEQVRTDLLDLRALGCDAVVLDTNPDQPGDRTSSIQDQRNLARIVRDYRAREVP